MNNLEEFLPKVCGGEFEEFGEIAALIAAGILIASRGKIKAKLGNMKLFQNLAQKPFFKKAGAFVKNAVTTVKDFFVNLVGKIKKKPALPPANV